MLLRFEGNSGIFRGRNWTFSDALTVGSHPFAELVLDEAETALSVSARHAFVWHDSGRWWIADAGSAQGTYLNNNRIGNEPAGPLRPGDVVQFGQVVVRVDSISPRNENTVSIDTGQSDPPRETPNRFVVLTRMWGTIRIGQPVRYRSLSVFPLFCEGSPRVDHLLSDEAVEGKLLTVTEVSQAGSVPELSVDNRADRPVLLLEGEELRGAKQNRMANTSILVPPQSKITIPVSCVERGRWRQDSADFHPGKTMCPYQLRQKLKWSVYQSLQKGLGHRSDQHSVWEDVESTQHSLGVTSPTLSMSDTWFACADHLAASRRVLKYVTGSSGMAVALGARIVTADMFNNPEICEKMWDRVLSGLVVDDLLGGNTNTSPEEAQVVELFEEIEKAEWTQTPTVGEGEDFRAEFNGGVASALRHQGGLLHGSVVCGVKDRADEHRCTETVIECAQSTIGLGGSITLQETKGPAEGTSWTGESLLRIGKRDGLEVVLKDTWVSRCHVEMRCTERGWRLRDLQSTNGTRLNGVRLGQGWWPLRVGDVIRAGEVELTVRAITVVID
jgi:pSer/pThr/pTyr-binding forkhead associated (FHA) protein